jgi:hypothetical protein
VHALEHPASVAGEWNRAKNGYFSKDQLQAYKTIWHLAYGPKPKQLKFDVPF